MGKLWTRLSALVTGSSNDPSHAPGPGAERADGAPSVARLRTELADIAARRRAVEYQTARVGDQIARLTTLATRALEDGNEALARDLVRYRMNVEQSLDDLHAQHSDLAAHEERLAIEATKAQAQADAARVAPNGSSAQRYQALLDDVRQVREQDRAMSASVDRLLTLDPQAQRDEGYRPGEQERIDQELAALRANMSASYTYRQPGIAPEGPQAHGNVDSWVSQ